MYNFNNFLKSKKVIRIKCFFVYINANKYVDNLFELSDLLNIFYFIHKNLNQITNYKQLNIVRFYQLYNLVYKRRKIRIRFKFFFNFIASVHYRSMISAAERVSYFGG